ncbi:MAG: hypothetical protein EBT95_09440 [Verrucomicrobia bacterium]|nr:hypothetical protein [Verrucomicrobiota bacterium]
MVLPLEIKTQDNVLAAQVRNVLANGGTWTDVASLTDNTGVNISASPNTIADVTDTQTAENAIARLTAKVNELIVLINNVNA